MICLMMTPGAVHPLAVYQLLTGRPLFAGGWDLAAQRSEPGDFFAREPAVSRAVHADGGEVLGGPGRREFFRYASSEPGEPGEPSEAGDTDKPPETLKSGGDAPPSSFPGSELELFQSFGQSGFLTECPSILSFLRIIWKFSGKPLAVLLQGDSGVGKELIARYIHQHSASSGGPFVAVNCGAIPQELVESVLFGHKKGAFTGATKDSTGLIVSANGGTLFLDEIGDLPLQSQVKFLRVLEERVVRPVGGTEEKPVNFRLVAATNKNLEKEVAAKRFREDFYYRLGMAIEVPPLRRRKEDIPLLVRHFIRHFLNGNRQEGAVTFEPGFIERLTAHDWPGNVRELKHAIEHAMAMRDGDILKIGDLPPGFQAVQIPSNGSQDLGELRTLTLARALELGLKPDELNLRYFALALELCGGNLSDVAKLLGVSRATAMRRNRQLKGRS